MKELGVGLLVLGVGGLVIYYIWKEQQAQMQTTVVDKGYGQCGASYAGVGASVPCALIGTGLEKAYNWVKDEAKPVIGEVKTASSGIKPIEYVVFPVGITHAAVNEIKRIPGLGWL